MEDDVIKNDYQLSQECDALAEAIFDEIMADNEGEDPKSLRDDMMDRAHEDADMSQHVIYTYRALQICANCDTSMGEQFLEDTGMPAEPTFNGLATIIAYGEMRGRIEATLDHMIDNWDQEKEEVA